MDVSHLFGATGKIKGKALRALPLTVISSIDQQTSFLINPTLVQRIRAIFYGVTEHTKCQFCGLPHRYSPHKGQMFNTSCGCDGYLASVDRTQRIEKFKETINSNRRVSNDAPIIPIDEVVSLLRQLLPPPSEWDQYLIKRTIESVPGLKDSILHYVPEGRVGYKLHKLLFPVQCKSCGKDTRYFDMNRGFGQYCKKCGSSRTKGSRNVGLATEKMTGAGLTVMQSPSSLQSYFTVKCDLGHEFEIRLNNGRMHTRDLTTVCPTCHPRSISAPEKELQEYVEGLGLEVIPQYVIEQSGKGKKKLDLFIPAINLAIEYIGLSWHSFGQSKYRMFNNHHKEDKLHLLKRTELCEKNGIQVLHVWSNEWLTKRAIWESVIRVKCGKATKIPARKCTVVDLTNEQYRAFTEANHLQGYAPASSKLGLVYQNELVAVMSFSKDRYKTGANHELIRFCSKLNCVVVGGMTKLLKHFADQNEGTIVSFANRRWSTGNVYGKAGFTLSHSSSPNYWYFLPNQETVLYSRVKFQRHKLEGPKDKTESEIMFDNGYRRIWDCGNHVFMWNNE